MKIGVGVEGPSDRKFWDKILHKHLQGCRFDLRNLNSKEKLIRATPVLTETFRDAHFDACIIIIDADDAQCASKVFELFSTDCQREARKPLSERFLHILVAVRELESWYLADREAIASSFSGQIGISPTTVVDTLNAEAIVRRLWKHDYPHSAFDKLGLAVKLAPRFLPARATSTSPSFSHAWDRMLTICMR